MSTPTRFPHGVTNAAKNGPLRNLPIMDPSAAHMWFDDFDNYTLAEWVITTTEAGAGSATEALADADGGQLVITNAAGDNDLDMLQWAGDTGAVTETFLLERGKQAWFKARLKVLEVIQCDWHIGLAITGTDPLPGTITDGVFFSSDDGDALIDVRATKDTSVTGLIAGIATAVADTFFEVAWYFDGDSELSYYIDGVKLGTLTLTDTAGVYLDIPDDEELTISFGIQNGTTVVNSMTIDYILAVKER